MKKLSKYKLHKISKNLDYFFNIATKKEIRQGLLWYKKANIEAKHISQLYNINILQELTYITRQHPLALDNSHLGPEAHKEVANVISTHIMCNQKKEN